MRLKFEHIEYSLNKTCPVCVFTPIISDSGADSGNGAGEGSGTCRNSETGFDPIYPFKTPFTSTTLLHH